MIISRLKELRCGAQQYGDRLVGYIVVGTKLEHVLQIILDDWAQSVLLLFLHIIWVIVYLNYQQQMENTKHLLRKTIGAESMYGQEKNPIKKIDLHNNTRLIMATFLDTAAIEQKFTPLRKLTQSMTIPQLYHFIKQYQNLFDRAYSQHLRSYIVAALWDQGFVKVGEAKDWQLLIESEEFHHKQRADGSWLGQIAKSRQLMIKDCWKWLGKKYSSSKEGEHEQNTKQLSTQLVLVIEQIEQQFHRQSLTLKYLFPEQAGQKGPQKMDQIMLLFNSLDQNKIGSVEYNKIAAQFAINPQANKNPIFNVCKFGNNLHIYDRHTNMITSPNNKIDLEHPGGLKINIENVMEIFNRALASQSGKDEVKSHTYETISHILTQYRRMKQKTLANMYSGEVKQLNERNEQIGLVARIEHIRQAAYNIVHHGKNKDMMNLRGLSDMDLQKQEREVETYRNQGTLAVESPNTFRRTNDVGEYQKVQDKTAEKFNKFRDIEMKNEGNSSTAANTKKESGHETQNRQRATVNPKQSALNSGRHRPFLGSITKTKEFSPRINAFTATSQPIESAVKADKHNEILRPKQGEIKYDQLLRERIFQEMQVLRLEKIRNKIRYYDILYHYQ